MTMTLKQLKQYERWIKSLDDYVLQAENVHLEKAANVLFEKRSCINSEIQEREEAAAKERAANKS